MSLDIPPLPPNNDDLTRCIQDIANIKITILDLDTQIKKINEDMKDAFEMITELTDEDTSIRVKMSEMQDHINENGEIIDELTGESDAWKKWKKSLATKPILKEKVGGVLTRKKSKRNKRNTRKRFKRK